MEGKGNWEDAEKKGKLVSITSLGEKSSPKGHQSHLDCVGTTDVCPAPILYQVQSQP